MCRCINEFGYTPILGMDRHTVVREIERNKFVLRQLTAIQLIEHVVFCIGLCGVSLLHFKAPPAVLYCTVLYCTALYCTVT